MRQQTYRAEPTSLSKSVKLCSMIERRTCCRPVTPVSLILRLHERFVFEAGAFPRSSYDARLELTASDAHRRFGRLFMSMNYHLMHRASSDPLRVASDAPLQQCVDLETLTEVPQVMRDLEVSHGLPLAAHYSSETLARALAHVKEMLSLLLSRCIPRGSCSTLQRCTFIRFARTAGLAAPLGDGVLGRETLAKVPNALVGV